MNKKFLIISIIILLILGIAIFFQIKMNKNIENQDNNQIAKNGDTITVHYVGTFENGNKFDSSVDRGEPFTFVLGSGQVIKGWDQGILGMKVGEKKTLTVPPELGYGLNDYGPIPGGSTLIFEVELLNIN